MTIQIPDDLARGLEAIAAARKLTVEQLAIERLRTLFERPASPPMLLRAIQALPHPSASAVDDLDAAIAAGRRVHDEGIFER
jgi:predicted transcriptional regulator